jgi:hypothetical protein
MALLCTGVVCKSFVNTSYLYWLCYFTIMLVLSFKKFHGCTCCISLSFIEGCHKAFVKVYKIVNI